MTGISLNDELTEEMYDDYLKTQRVAHNDSVLQEGETFFDLLLSPEGDFTRYPEGKIISEKLSG